MLQAYGSNENVVALLPSTMRTRSAGSAGDGERGRVILFTGVRRERMEIAQSDRLAVSHRPDGAGQDDAARS